MAYRYDFVYRLEPHHHYADLSRGMAAEVADPVWFLGRQWQLGEHHGEDAGSPVHVEYRASQVPIEPAEAGPDPRTVPAEAIIESEPDDFWTVGRRISLGRAVERAAAEAGLPLPEDDKYRLANLPVPYDLLDGTGFDGRPLFEDRPELGLPDEWFPERPPATVPHDLWNATELAYDADFRADATTLTARRHDGGSLDWWSVDASAPVSAPDQLPDSVTVMATRIRYPGAPHPRWWEIEDTRSDLGAYAPDRGHFATLLLLELVTSHSDDWFTFPLTGRAGHVLTVHEARVLDAFGGDDQWMLEPPDDGWTFFSVTGLDQRSLVLWPSVPGALAGPVIDQVDFGVDEDANLIWAVERRTAGRDRPTVGPPSPQQEEGGGPAGQQADATAQPRYTYRPATDVPEHWHPYVLDGGADGHPRRLVQARLADPTRAGGGDALTPLPETSLLRPNPRTGGSDPIHRIEPAAIPIDGLQLERRYLLGRGTDGLPILWKQRRRLPLATPPVLRLQFDSFVAE